MSPQDHIADTGKMVSPTITILATDNAGTAVCSRCGRVLDRSGLVVVRWNQLEWCYCGTCRERMGI